METFSELRYPEANRIAFYGISGPAQMDKDTVKTINEALRKVMLQPEIKTKIDESGSYVLVNSPEEFTKQIKDEYEAYKGIIASQGISSK